MAHAPDQVLDHSRARRILLLAAACNPFRGSDCAVGWHRALEAANYFDTWVICSASDREDIHRYLQEKGEIPQLHFCFVEDTPLDRLLNCVQPFYYTNFLAYYLWQRRAFKLARQLHEHLKFDLTHQASLIGYREPSFLWRLEPPFVWGPVGGTQNYPWRFLYRAGFGGILLEGLRSIVNYFQFRFSPRVRLAAQKAACVVAANADIQQNFLKIHGVKAKILLDIGLEKIPDRQGADRRLSNPLRLLWSGDLKHHKALHLLLQALALLPPEFSYELKILGKGPLESRWQGLARRLGVADRCLWMGWLPYDRAMEQYEWADLFIFTSLRETTGTVLLEAMGQGVPVICLDHHGAKYLVTEECGVKVPVTTPAEVIRNLKDAIMALADDQDRIDALSRGARARARRFLWSHNGKHMAGIYRAVMENSGASEKDTLPRSATSPWNFPI
jgi:glycosyltransferase involved in cell wall biosynthesis